MANSFAVSVFIFLLITTPMPAAADSLRGQLRPLVPSPRRGGPVPVEVTFIWSGAQLLEGYLEIEYRAGNRSLLRYRGVDWALPAGEQRYQVLLPPAPATDDDVIKLRLKFVTDTASYPLGETLLPTDTWMEPAALVGLCRPSGTRRSVAHDLPRTLRPDLRRDPDAFDSEARQSVKFAAIEPDQISAQPLALCAFDMLVITADGLAELRDRQLRSVTDWVRAGGSLLVFADNDGTKEQRGFLFQLAHQATSTTLPRAASGLPMTLARFGLGRAVVVNVAAGWEGIDYNSDSWRDAVTFLWKARTLEGQGRLMEDWPDGSDDAIRAQLIEYLMPREVRLVPTWLLVQSLVVFLLVIGPGDYYLLGWLRLRRFTWIFFPLMTIAFTWFIVRVANHYLGGGMHRRALVVIDVGHQGRVIRHNRFELLFSGHHSELQTVCTGALWSPMAAETRYRGRADEAPSVEPVTISGLVPGKYNVSQAVRQWTPQLNRLLSFSAPPDVNPPDWEAINPSDLGGPEGVRRLRRRLIEQLGAQTELMVFRGSPDAQVISGTPNIPLELWAPLCVRDYGRPGLMLTQISPQISDRIRDLPIFDLSNPRETLVLITVRRGNEVLLYRRLYYE